MSDYRVLPGLYNSLASLQVITPQPMSPGIQSTREEFTGGGFIVEMGMYLELSWNVLGSAAMALAVYTYFGLHTQRAGQVTLYARDGTFAYQLYNGLAVRPNPTWENFFPKRITILVRDCVPI